LSRLLNRIGNLAAHRRWFVIGAWGIAILLAATAVKTLGANTSNNLDLPGTDSEAATDLLAARFPPQQNGANLIVFKTASGKVTDAANKQAIEQAHAAILAKPHVFSATSPFSQQGAAQISADQRTAFIPVLLNIDNEDITEDVAQGFLDAATVPTEKAHMEVAAGGQIGTELSEPDTASSDIIGLAVATIILAFTFGSLVAMGLPIASAVVGLIVGLSAIGLLGNVVSVPSIAPTLGTMIGLGVGIDYALFLVSRHRTQVDDGMEVDDSIVKSVLTTGSAIFYAGGTVVIALVTLLIAGIPLVTSLGYAAAVAVITAVLAATTFLPALLSVVGRHIHSLRLPTFMRPSPKPPDGGFWGAWARWVTTHPGRAILLALLILVPLAIPLSSLQLGQEDVGAAPKSTTERQAYDLISAGFGPGYNGPLLVAVSLGTPATPDPEFEKQYNHAQSLQAELESEQSTGEAEAASLQAQAAALQAEQVRLQAAAAVLTEQGADLSDEKAQLKQSAAKLQKKRTILAQFSKLVAQATALAKQGAQLAHQAAVLAQKLVHNRVLQERTQAQIATATDPAQVARLEARLQALQRREQQLQTQLDQVEAAQAEIKAQADALKADSEKLRRQASKLGKQTLALASDAAATIKQAITLVQQKNKLQLQAANAKVQAAQLQTQKAQLDALQQQAKTQQKQAENLQATLTAELTAAGGDQRGTDPRLVALQDGLEAALGVKLVSPPKINDDANAAVFTVIATTAPAAEATAELVARVRDYVIPQATAGTDLDAHVGGSTASYEDLATAISSKLLLVIVVVVGLGFLVLMMAFRSILVPAQAAVANVLSVCAAFGVVTAVFQKGWGLSLVGLDTASGTDPVASFVPLIMFAVLFGLSMDYQVFLMSQIEHHRATAASDREAIALGLATGARVIVAAALIMISVFASFILNGDPTVKQFGVGLSIGVALAATTVLLFAPAVLVLAGKGAWWVPKWADRFLPHIDIEGEGAAKKDSLGPMKL
jgi:uncharacterized membrane protein YdfJ with MMPL/SSD domain